MKKKKEILSQKDWERQLEYRCSNVVWEDKFGSRRALWSKHPTIGEDGELIMVDNVKKAIQYYESIVNDPLYLLASSQDVGLYISGKNDIS